MKIISEINSRNAIKAILDTIVTLVVLFMIYKFKYNVMVQSKIPREIIALYLFLYLFLIIVFRNNTKSWSYVSGIDIKNIILSNVGSLFFLYIIMQFYKRDHTIYFYIFYLISVVSIQLFMRYLFKMNLYRRMIRQNVKNKEKILVYGAGEAGTMLAKEAETNPNFPYEILGFIDDDTKKYKTKIRNILVLGGKNKLKKHILELKIKEIIIALPSLKREQLNELIDEIMKLDLEIKIKILPKISDIVIGENYFTQVHEIKIEDLLGRDQIDINTNEIRKFIERKKILITGGAGSIGSELARQISKYSPEELIILDMSETPLYFLELELKRMVPNINIKIEVCNIKEKEKVDMLFEKYRPHILFHAAAYKHVPLMENNPEEAIKNNIFGTKYVMEAANKNGVEKVVLISTDKAVNPTNIMGATKRACELIVEEMNKKSEKTKYTAVRFGNVLGSNGSVIPIFQKLIEEGKNLTVTHKDITRYFMTIPEAAQLVIEAGNYAKGGEIFILDMGEPVKIYDLAKKMIKLSKKNIGIDIVGLRAGEKLYEELLYDVNNAIKTDNKKIFITKIEKNKKNIEEYYEKLEKVVENPNKDEIKELMKEIIDSYREREYN